MKTNKGQLVARMLSLVVGVLVASFLMMPKSSDAVIHEIVAAYCSGGGVGAIDENGVLEPPGIGDPLKGNFARPVIASGAVDLGTLTTTNKPNSKFPAGTSVFAAIASASNHPSAAHCPNVADLP